MACALAGTGLAGLPARARCARPRYHRRPRARRNRAAPIPFRKDLRATTWSFGTLGSLALSGAVMVVALVYSDKLRAKLYPPQKF
ncbi:MAG TPA: hypothetical protein VNF69_08830 [Burkholderiales bacterium]|nr:hypothetical protein [Burkholderiales bacterium]